jgi:3-deoxy-D-manno-octulosonic-acid transferase
MKAIGDYELAHPNEEPFIDADEMADPELHRRREVLRQRYNFNKSKNRPTPPTTTIEGVKSVGEILSEHPLIKKLIE